MDARLYHATTPDGLAPIGELSVVSLVGDIDVPAMGRLPEGTLGTVVSVYGGGEVYEVEFEAPVHALLTLASKDIRPVPEATRERVIAASKLVSDRRD